MLTLSHIINTETSANGVHFRLLVQVYPPASVSETAHGRKKGISMNGQYCVQMLRNARKRAGWYRRKLHSLRCRWHFPAPSVHPSFRTWLERIISGERKLHWNSCPFPSLILTKWAVPIAWSEQCIHTIVSTEHTIVQYLPQHWLLLCISQLTWKKLTVYAYVCSNQW